MNSYLPLYYLDVGNNLDCWLCPLLLILILILISDLWQETKTERGISLWDDHKKWECHTKELQREWFFVIIVRSKSVRILFFTS